MVDETGNKVDQLEFANTREALEEFLCGRTGHITKQGSRWLRWILVQCVHVAVRQKDSRLGKYYARLCRRKKKQVATVATACKLLEIIYAML